MASSDYNSPFIIKEWVKKVICGSRVSIEDKELLVRTGCILADRGEWRGNISDTWKAMGYSTGDIPGMYP